MTFDISKYELEETATLTVQNAKGDDDLIGADGVNPVTIDLYGDGSDQMTKAKRKAGQAAAMRFQRTIRGKVDKREADAAEEELNEKLIACTKSINNFPLSAQALYSNPKLGYIKDQVIGFLNDSANFSKTSTQNSAST